MIFVIICVMKLINIGSSSIWNICTIMLIIYGGDLIVKIFERLILNICLYKYWIQECVMVELLLSKGADVNILSCCGTPLHVAAMENQGAVMKILLDNNADVSFISFDVFGVL